MPVPQTPAMQQYFRMKAEYPEALLFFRMGDFYELFFDDARVAAPILDIALTSRSKDANGESIPMCGVPHHALSSYARLLVEKGHRVAIGEQLEDPKAAKGVVKRGVVRVITPGTMIDEDTPTAPGGAAGSRIAAVVAGRRGTLGVACLDAVSGDFFYFERSDESAALDVAEDLSAIAPREILIPRDDVTPGPVRSALRRVAGSPPIFELDVEFEPRRARDELLRHFSVANLEALGAERSPEAATAAGACLQYLRGTQKREVAHVTSLVRREDEGAMILDEATRRNLELVSNLVDGSERGTLLSILNHTRSPMGPRLLREWILRPLAAREPVQDRLDAVEEFAYRARERQDLQTALANVRDLDRFVARLTFGRATPRDLAALASSLRAAQDALTAAQDLNAPLVRENVAAIDVHESLARRIAATLVDAPPPLAAEGGLVRDGFDAEVDELRSLHRGGKDEILAIETRERERTGIASLKVRFNRVFGYYIEVTKANLAAVPADYIRRQTIVNGERFVTEELKTFEEKVLRAEEKLLAREQAIFDALVSEAAAHVKTLAKTSRALATLDVLASLAEAAVRRNYVKPHLAEAGEFVLREGRHPVVEALSEDAFVANDVDFGPAAESPRLFILTGPNMGGKSTYLRQIGLSAVMAQMGSFVPAAEAKIAVCDRLFTRVGASDYLLRGQSTFMVEMQETAYILRHATEKSLILFDEVGRGTATYDGLSLAWAIAEHLAERGAACPRTVFATHYHELVDLALERPAVANLHVAAREWKDDILFLRRVEKGGSDRSFGIQVAKLSGLPAPVVKRAREILKNLEQTEFDADGRPTLARTGLLGAPKQRQMSLFTPSTDRVAEDLRALDVNALTPVDALNALVELKKKLENP